MRKLRIDLYSGYRDDKSFTEHDVFKQEAGETVEQLLFRVTAGLLETSEQLTYEDEGDDDD